MIAVIALIDARLSREDAAGADRLQRLQAARDSAARALDLTRQLTAIGADDR